MNVDTMNSSFDFAILEIPEEFCYKIVFQIFEIGQLKDISFVDVLNELCDWVYGFESSEIVQTPRKLDLLEMRGLNNCSAAESLSITVVRNVFERTKLLCVILKIMLNNRTRINDDEKMDLLTQIYLPKVKLIDFCFVFITL